MIRRFVAMAIVVAAVMGSTTQPADALEPTVRRVVVVSIPGLQWADLEHAPSGAIEQLLARSATGTMSIRTAGSATKAADGYVTAGAGNRARAGDDPTSMVSAVTRAHHDRYGAEPGALAKALARSGHHIVVVGSSTNSASVALMAADSSGHVVTVNDLASVTAGDVAVVELADLTATGGDRPARVASADGALNALLASIDREGDLVLLVAPAAPGERAELTVVALAQPGATSHRSTTGALRSATTRRAPYVTLPDVAPTVLQALGVDIPTSMNGTAFTIEGGRSPSTKSLAQLNRRTVFRDRAVGPCAVVLVVFVVLSAVAHRLRQRRLALVLGRLGLALPTVMFISGAVAFERLGWAYGPLVALATVTVAGAATLAAARWAPLANGVRWPTVEVALVALLFVTLMGDVVSGGHWQIDTPFGYSPTVAGRFQGIGNLAYAFLAPSALLIACLVFAGRDSAGRRPLWTAGTVIGATIVVDGAGVFGADLGGVLALVPAGAAALTIASGRRVTLARLVTAGIVAVGVVALFAGLDLLRPASSRSHLGRFAARLIHGDFSSTVNRKLAANGHVLVSSPWTMMVPVLFAAVVMVAFRRSFGDADGARGRALRAAGWSLAILGVVGFLANDTGVVIPAVIMAVTVPVFGELVATPTDRATP